jgi:hypothetical protein
VPTISLSFASLVNPVLNRTWVCIDMYSVEWSIFRRFQPGGGNHTFRHLKDVNCLSIDID